jgi:hypothetical protein
VEVVRGVREVARGVMEVVRGVIPMEHHLRNDRTRETRRSVRKMKK